MIVNELSWQLSTYFQKTLLFSSVLSFLLYMRNMTCYSVFLTVEFHSVLRHALLYSSEPISSTVYMKACGFQSILDCIFDQLGHVRLPLKVSVKKIRMLVLSLFAFQEDKIH